MMDYIPVVLKQVLHLFTFNMKGRIENENIPEGLFKSDYLLLIEKN